MRILLLFSLLFYCSALHAQQDSAVKRKPQIFVDEMPVFNGGYEKWLSENVSYPKKARRKNIQGIVYVQLQISETGEVCGVKLLKSVHPLLDEEALRVFRAMPDWTPGKQNGVAVPCLMNIPLKFALR